MFAKSLKTCLDTEQLRKHPSSYLVPCVLLPRLGVPPAVLLPPLLLLPLPPLPALTQEELCVVPPATGLGLAGRAELRGVDLEKSFELKSINMCLYTQRTLFLRVVHCPRYRAHFSTDSYFFRLRSDRVRSKFCFRDANVHLPPPP